MLLKKNKNIKTLRREDQFIFLNRLNGKWIKIPADVADIINYADEQNMEDSEVRKMLFDEEDRLFFDNLLVELKKMDFFLENNDFAIKVDNVSYAITEKCNLCCKHCMINAKSNRGSEYFDTNEIKENLTKIIDLNPRNIIITGGEPLLRTDFAEISRFCREHYTGTLTLMTNGTLIDENNASELASIFDSFDISIDGYDEYTCSMIRGEGVFQKVINAIKLLSENGAEKINTSMVLSATNANYIDEYILLNKKLGTRPMLRALSYEGRAKTNENELKKDFSNKQTIPKFINNNEQDVSKDKFKCCSCTAGYYQLVVEAKGDIFPCNLFIGEQYLMGNIKVIDKLEDLFQDTDYCMAPCVEKYDPSKYIKCKDCDVSYFCWSCLYSMVKLDDVEFEERCNYKKRILNKIWS